MHRHRHRDRQELHDEPRGHPRYQHAGTAPRLAENEREEFGCDESSEEQWPRPAPDQRTEDPGGERVERSGAVLLWGARQVDLRYRSADQAHWRLHRRHRQCQETCLRAERHGGDQDDGQLDGGAVGQGFEGRVFREAVVGLEGPAHLRRRDGAWRTALCLQEPPPENDAAGTGVEHRAKDQPDRRPMQPAETDLRSGSRARLCDAAAGDGGERLLAHEPHLQRAVRTRKKHPNR